MSIIGLIKADQLAARKAKAEIARSLLTTLMSEAIAVAKNLGAEDPTDEQTIATIRKFLKNNAEVQLHGVGDALATAKAEATLLAKYLPTQLTEDQLSSIIDGAILNNCTNVGTIMASLKQHHAGLYDAKMASILIKNKLST